MLIKPYHFCTFLLGVSALLLALLIPGGPFENRDFSHISPIILALFNIFLTTLNLGTLLLMIFTFRNQGWAIAASSHVAMAYFGVYSLDLLQIFPKSPTAMSSALLIIEVVGITASVPLVIFNRRILANCETTPSRVLSKRMKSIGMAILILSGFAIVDFSTTAAMYSNN